MPAKIASPKINCDSCTHPTSKYALRHAEKNGQPVRVCGMCLESINIVARRQDMIARAKARKAATA